MATSFLSILSTSSEFSTGHAFHLFKLIFSMVTSFVLLSEEKISKKLNEKVKESFELCVRVLISTLFLIIFLLFTSLDTSGTWNMNGPATKTSTRCTYSALPGLKNFISGKNWSQAFCQF